MLKDQIRNARKAAGLTQKQVAAKLEITESTYCGYETGKRQPDAIKLKEISKVLNVSGDVLLETGFTAEEISPEIDIIKSPPMEDGDEEILNLYHQLDLRDQALIEGEMRGMLKNEKYQQECQSKDA